MIFCGLKCDQKMLNIVPFLITWGFQHCSLLFSSLFPSTCVSSRYSRKCVTLLKLGTELKTNLSLLAQLFLGIFFKTLIYLISNDMTYILIKLILTCPMNCPYTLSDQKYATNQCLFKHWLKHKCLIVPIALFLKVKHDGCEVLLSLQPDMSPSL